MPVFGIRCTKEEIFVAVLEGSKEKPIVTDKARLEIILKAPKTAENRPETLNYLKRELSQVFAKYSPTQVCLKEQENSSQKIPVKSIAQRGEIEGIVQLLCFEFQIPLERAYYAEISTNLALKQRKKQFLMNAVDDTFGPDLKKNDNIKDAILCAWAVL